MRLPANFVSLHPYFKAHPGKLEAMKAGLPAFRHKTATEEKNLFYDFTISGDEVFCRAVSRVTPQHVFRARIALSESTGS